MVRIVLTLAAQCHWPIHQLNVNNAFLHGVLDEQVYARQPAGFVDSSAPTSVCRLQEPLWLEEGA
jgi:hypothetical protein